MDKTRECLREILFLMVCLLAAATFLDVGAAEPAVEPVIIPIVVMGKNFSGMTTPTVTAREYRGCNFTTQSAILVKGKWVGVPFYFDCPSTVTLVRCNGTNRQFINLQPFPVVQVGCNGTLRVSQVASGTTETLFIDGKPFSIQMFEDRIFGYTDSNGEAVYKEVVLRIPTDPPERTKDAEIKRLVEEWNQLTSEVTAKIAELEAVK